MNYSIVTGHQRGEARGAAVNGHCPAKSQVSALEMLGAFASVGATQFDLTLTAEDGDKVSFQRAVPVKELCRIMPDLLDRCSGQRWNIIVRPKGPPVLLQLDDLDLKGRDSLKDIAFLTLETSPGSYQSWIALLTASQSDVARRLRKGVGADPTASGASRIAGSLNFKPRHAPNYPRVSICKLSPGLLIEERQLEESGLLSRPNPVSASPARVSAPRLSKRRWPSYERCLDGAPANADGTAPDKSRADFTFCLIAIDWGWSIELAAERLMMESAKAKENGFRYAHLTAERAAEAVSSRSAMKRHSK